MKRHAPATARNSDPLAEVLGKELPETGLVLEIASGSGEHAVFMARRFPSLVWQPSDLDTAALASVDAWAEEAGLANLRPTIELDATLDEWPIENADAMVCVNMIHISPWRATIGLFAAANRILPPEAPLILYGPFTEPDVETAPSNVAFDESLRARNPAWGLRDVADLDDLAQANMLYRAARYPMPANNLTLVYRRALRHK
ncbi:DUF938 domain-containing protein [Qipengyuania qiaonensis]|uniref:DUF938 domain-containing protein n=1 Tax=Qipengyuania qiaonensis TaxID=2867240 RepID=A0ABS7J8K1_9SPHN|nr:DUF938 domain-containing protein [Qipengyuania qiaonensis]MBX7483667.1 DUF938 domain-containing protein [Qipengyuania qiaonensis]